MLINPPQKALTLAKENGIKELIKWDLLNPGEERGGRGESLLVRSMWKSAATRPRGTRAENS